nr:MAG TPA: hypothetical protein [Caudoviricetes sp.]DAJ00442.1 MAG TPA: hypothetical protein [Caudoviricetes sp.]
MTACIGFIHNVIARCVLFMPQADRWRDRNPNRDRAQWAHFHGLGT